MKAVKSRSENNLKVRIDAVQARAEAEREQVKALLDSFEMVYRFEGVGTYSVESLGFKDGKLVFFDGHEIRPISPRKACEWLAEMSRFCGRFVLDQTSCDQG